jgi:DNA-binding NarL/FixJ family response regulator
MTAAVHPLPAHIRAQSPDRREIRVALVSGHPLYRDGFRQALRAAPHMVPVEGVRASDAVAIARERLADVLLIDMLDLPGGTAELAATLARDHPEVRVVLLSDSEHAGDATAALEAGVSGFVLKTVQGAELVEIVQNIHEGGRYIAPQLAARAIRLKYADPPAEKPRELTQREAEVLGHLSAAMTNKEIARVLNISERTVKHYMTVILDKLNARNRVEAALSARRPAAK